VFVRGGNDFFRGIIDEGGNNQLDARPHGNDVVVGWIEPGDDQNLQSRPHGNDYVRGFIDGGPLGDPDGGKLNPELNNSAALIAGVGGDDQWDPDEDVITTGPDGVRHTLLQPGSDDIEVNNIADGEGLAMQECIDGSNGQFPAGETNAGGDYIDTAATAGDDELLSGAHAVEGPNQHAEIIVNVNHHDTIGWGWNYTRETTPNGVVNDQPDGNLPAALQADDVDFREMQNNPYRARRRNLIRQTILHECAHGMHVSHYFLSAYMHPDLLPWNAPPTLLAGGNVDFQPHFNPQHYPDLHGEPWNAPPVNPDAICGNSGVISPQNPPAAGDTTVPDDLDETSLRQIRLHLKH
jgi:hypothetical protein